MNIKELAKTMTKEEFLNDKKLVYASGCPKYHGLENSKKSCYRINCKDCWDKALKNIKFKGEDEMKKINWEDRDNTVVHCDTEEKAKDFLKECDKRGIEWRNNCKASNKLFRELYGENTCYNIGTEYLGYSGKDFYKSEGYKIIEWEISEPKELFTFQEVIANIKDGEKYISKSQIVCLKEITLQCGLISFNGKFNNTKELCVDSKALFYKEESKKEYTIYQIEHTPEGKIYNFRKSDKEALMVSKFVICNTSKGKTYGKVIYLQNRKMTEKEYLEYATIENVNE